MWAVFFLLKKKNWLSFSSRSVRALSERRYFMAEDRGRWEDSGSTTKTATRAYIGFSSEVDKLPTQDIATGTVAFCVDTGDAYMFHEADEQWHLL